MSAPVSSLPNLGPKSEVHFARAGINSADELRELGAEAANLKLLHAGTRPHFIGFCALWLGLQGRPWTDLQSGEKAAIRPVFDRIVAESKRGRGDNPGPDIERALDALGVVRKR